MADITDKTFTIPIELVRRHAAWSEVNFGTREEHGPVGPLRHLAKEAIEASEAHGSPDPLHFPGEIADCAFLLLDSMRRAGMTSDDLVAAMERKMPILEARVYRKTGKDQPIEHDRSIDD